MTVRCSLLSRVRALRALPQRLADFDTRLAALDAREAQRHGANVAREEQLRTALHDLREQVRNARPRPSLYMGDHIALTTTVWDTQMYIDTRDLGFTPHILTHGFWELANTNVFLRFVREGMTVVEVGANFGYFTLIGARTVGPKGKYYAFEPNEATFRCLEKSVVINGLSGHTMIVNKAVSDYTGTARLHMSAVYTTNSNIVDDYAVIGNLSDVFTEVDVDVVTLDAFFGTPPPKVDFVKVDAEGSEPAIFRGMEQILRGNDDIQILFEYAPTWLQQTGDPTACLHYLSALGFRFWRVEGADGQLVETSIAELALVPFCELYVARHLR